MKLQLPLPFGRGAEHDVKPAISTIDPTMARTRLERVFTLISSYLGEPSLVRSICEMPHTLASIVHGGGGDLCRK